MNAPSMSSQHCAAYQLRFIPLCQPGRALTFPCDAKGQVDMDTLSDRARVDYFYARAVVGCEFARPAVQVNA